MIDNFNQRIDNFIDKKDESRHHKTAKGTVSQKRRRSDNFPLENEIKACRRPRFEPEFVKNSLENFLNNPGLQDLAENICSYLNYQDLSAFQLICRSSKSTINNPISWLKKFIQRGMSNEHQNDWLNAIQLTENMAFPFANNIYMYLKRSSCEAIITDVPYYVNEEIIEKSSELMKQSTGPSFDLFSLYKLCDNEDKYYRKYIPGFTQIFYYSWYDRKYMPGSTQIFMYKAVNYRNFELVKALAPLLENPNDPYFEDGSTPICDASRIGHLEIIKFLVPLADNLTSAAIDEAKDIAALYDNDHVLKYLSELSVRN